MDKNTKHDPEELTIDKNTVDFPTESTEAQEKTESNEEATNFLDEEKLNDDLAKTLILANNPVENSTNEEDDSEKPPVSVEKSEDETAPLLKFENDFIDTTKDGELCLNIHPENRSVPDEELKGGSVISSDNHIGNRTVEVRSFDQFVPTYARGNSWNKRSADREGAFKCGARDSADPYRRRLIDETYWRDKSPKLRETSSDLPSTALDRDCLFYPSEPFIKKLGSEAGKWMLFGNGNYKKMDENWNRLLRANISGLVALKTSTRKDPREGVIRAYTRDSKNVEEVKMVGEKILEVIGFEEPTHIYYKSNEASERGEYRHEGATKISSYKLDRSQFYIRGEDDKWQPWENNGGNRDETHDSD